MVREAYGERAAVVVPFTSNVHSIITQIRTAKELAAGNMVRRACLAAGEKACTAVCQLPERDNTDKACADQNLLAALEANYVNPRRTLMVGVTGDNVGFLDALDPGTMTENSVGVREVKGYNAFFARAGEEHAGRYIDALGRRLADCADVNFAFRDQDGKHVIGFMHGTRTNLFGKDRYKFEANGRKVSYTEHALSEALEHYDADPSTVRIRLSAAIEAHHFTKKFPDEKVMEGHLPGWFDEGKLVNQHNPYWQPGQPFSASDTWLPDYRGMVVGNIREAMTRLAIPEHHLDMEGAIDPAASDGVHSSHVLRDQLGDTRDLYLTVARAY